MGSLERIERARGGAFTFRVNGVVETLPPAAEMSITALFAALESERAPALLTGVPLWKLDALFTVWRDHNDLPPYRDARRLAYNLDRYADEIEHDLAQHYSGINAGALWRGRQWRRLLVLIDRLPGHSHYADAVANDEEHAKMLADAGAFDEDKTSTNPSLRTWTPEVAALNILIDAVRDLRYATVAVQVGSGKAGQPPPPMPRPVTAIERARQTASYRRKLENHKSLVTRLLPHKAGSSD